LEDFEETRAARIDLVYSPKHPPYVFEVRQRSVVKDEGLQNSFNEMANERFLIVEAKSRASDRDALFFVGGEDLLID
jgi:hypothetical protein